MNIDVRIVSQVGGWSGASPLTPAWPSQASSPSAVTAHWSPGWVISYGIAPYSTTFCVERLRRSK